MQEIQCEKCNEQIRFGDEIESARCNHCGAFYEITKNLTEDQVVKRDYNFVNFQCVYATYLSICHSICPAPEMYCKEHTDEKSFLSAEQTLSYNKKRLEVSEDVLEQMKESKKIWLIEEVSGINEDSSIR